MKPMKELSTIKVVKLNGISSFVEPEFFPIESSFEETPISGYPVFSTSSPE